MRLVKGRWWSCWLDPRSRSSAKMEWLAGPEVSRMIGEFENCKNDQDRRHHDAETWSPKSLRTRNVLNVITVFEETEQSVADDGTEYDGLAFRQRYHGRRMSLTHCKKHCENWRTAVYQSFVKERLIDRSKPVSEVIKKKQNLATFLLFFQEGAIQSKRAKIQVLKEDCALFSRLYIACQNRDGNLEGVFLSMKNQPWTPSIAEMGQLRGGQKADLGGVPFDQKIGTLRRVTKAMLDICKQYIKWPN
ncbi:hypothetical protein QZH41_020161, partial [Actinostola sp. cb2023]